MRSVVGDGPGRPLRTGWEAAFGSSGRWPLVADLGTIQAAQILQRRILLQSQSHRVELGCDSFSPSRFAGLFYAGQFRAGARLERRTVHSVVVHVRRNFWTSAAPDREGLEGEMACGRLVRGLTAPQLPQVRPYQEQPLALEQPLVLNQPTG
jgi:hypothetical protein